MFRVLAIIGGVIVGLGLLVGAGFALSSGNVDSATMNEYTIKKAYLAKNTKNYSRYYNSINHGRSKIGDVRLQIIGDNFYDKSITSERLDVVEDAFMKTVEDQCKSTVDGYETAYSEAEKAQKKIKDAQTSWLSTLLGTNWNESAIDDLSSYEPSHARLSLFFTDVIFTDQQVRDFFDK